MSENTNKIVEKGPVDFSSMNEFLAYCSVSPLSLAARDEMSRFLNFRAKGAHVLFQEYDETAQKNRLHVAAAQLMRTSPEHLSFVPNTSTGINMIARGYPWKPRDVVISFCREYPANYHPWAFQERDNKVSLRLLPDVGDSQWTMGDLAKSVCKDTRVISLSHVQYESGFAADLVELGEFCLTRDIDLIIDAAQSLGSLPVYPEKYGISAVIASGWKWLLGPLGSGVMYTSKSFREKLSHVLVGAEMMKDYLGYDLEPFEDGRRFEYSTVGLINVVGLSASIEQVFLDHSLENISRNIFELQDLLLSKIDRDRYVPLEFPKKHRSGILALKTKRDCREISSSLVKEKMCISTRGNHLRLAPHFFTSRDGVERCVELLNRL